MKINNKTKGKPVDKMYLLKFAANILTAVLVIPLWKYAGELGFLRAGEDGVAAVILIILLTTMSVLYDLGWHSQEARRPYAGLFKWLLNIPMHLIVGLYNILKP